MRILLAAEEGAGVRALKLSSEAGHRIAGVLTASDPARGGTVAALTKALGLPLLPASRLKDPAFAAEIQSLGIDVLLNVHSLYVVREPILHALRIGGFNLHPGPLPGYAGLNAPSWAILRGEPRHGVTLHWMTAGIDMGAIAYQEMFDLDPAETGLSATLKCVRIGMSLIGRLLEALAADPAQVPQLPQDLSRRRYFGREKPFDGRPPLSLTSAEMERLVRASDYAPFPSPWGAPRLRAGGRDIGLLRVRRTGVAADAAPGTLRRQAEGVLWLALPDEWLALVKIEMEGPSSPARETPETESGRSESLELSHAWNQDRLA